MAEIPVNLLIKKLGPLLVQEVKLLSGVHTEIESMKNKLESIRKFLKDAEAKAAAQESQGNSKDSVEQWVPDVREMAYCIEDVIDEYAFTAAQLPHGNGICCALQKICCFVKELILRHNIANDIQDIKSKLVEIDNRRKSYGFNSIEQGSSSERINILRPGGCGYDSYYIKEDQIVGHESIREEIKEQLVNRIPQRRVVALVGAGGQGKTTLAASAYKNKDVRSHFTCHAWIYVGKAYIKEDLLRKTIRNLYDSMKESAPGNIEKMDGKELTDILRKYLENKSYLVVFDDVWEVEFWKDVEHAVLDNNKSSRIIITMRNQEVADSIPGSIIHHSLLQPLPTDEAWELFRKKAFGFDGHWPVELVELSYKLLAKCGGLPVAIVALGGLLSNKNKSATEWKKLLENLSSKPMNHPQLQGCNRVLYESYNDLPHHLKACLLYFGLFPKGYSISIGKLVRLWIAEGFVQQTDENLLEQVAKDYLIELIQRSLIRVSETYLNGGIRRCQVVHDLMHDIILIKTKELGFSRVLSEQGDTSQQKITRRIAIYMSNNNVLESITNSKVRSFFIFNGFEQPNSFMKKLVANFKLMKVLVFENAPLDDVPEEVGNLFHLHYLSLRKTKVKTLPKSIGKLVNLESLDLRETFVRELPHEIKYLKKLRCLLIYNLDSASVSCGEGTKLPQGFGPSADMQKLSYVLANSSVLKELKNLRQMRHLGINLEKGTGEDLCDCIGNMENLKVLYLELANTEMTLDIQSITSLPQYLERLVLVGKLKELPNWISKLQNLFRIHLYKSCLTVDPMTALHCLPNLLELSLVDSYIGEQFHIKDGWFSELQELCLIDLKGLKCIMIEDGAMPSLRMLWIERCQLLKEIPKGIKHLRKLNMLLFVDMLKEVASGLITYDNLEQLKHVQNVLVLIEGEGYMDVRGILDKLPESAGCQNTE